MVKFLMEVSVFIQVCFTEINLFTNLLDEIGMVTHIENTP